MGYLRAIITIMSSIGTQSTDFAALRLEQRGRAGELLPIVLLNTLLNIITLSIYRFWGKTKVRQYLWRQTYFMGEALEYTGSGGELFKGFLAVFFLILVPLGAIGNVAGIYLDPESAAFAVYTAAFYTVIWFLIGMAVYRARRYRLSRTVWRGIRGGMRGSSGQYAARYLIFSVLAVITLGWAYPWMRVTLFQRIMAETMFGDRNFRVGAPLAPLYRVFAVYWLGSAATLILAIIFIRFTSLIYLGGPEFEAADMDMSQGWVLLWPLIPVVGWMWYRTHEINQFANNTSFQGLSFRMNASVWNLSGLVFINALIVVFTLGFGQPFAQLRTFRYFCDHLTIMGEINVDWIEQSSAESPSIGEGLADAFDLGAV